MRAFTDPPRSTQALRGRVAQYVKLGRSSLDWAGADWTSPTSLDFETTTITARTYGATRALSPEPIHPAALSYELADLWEDFRRAVLDERMVVDAQERLGVTFHPGPGPWAPVEVVMRAKCWPAVEGVTTPRRDRTW